jgi:hypothetical protein
MPKIYSYVEADGKSLIPPAAKPPKFDALVYLAEIDGRHYVSVKEDLPEQPQEIKLEGPLNLKGPKNRELAAALGRRAEPWRRTRFERAAEYPAIGDQLDALMKEFARRRDAGEKLAPELDAMLARVLEVKTKFPKDDLGLDPDEAGAEEAAGEVKGGAAKKK